LDSSFVCLSLSEVRSAFVLSFASLASFVRSFASFVCFVCFVCFGCFVCCVCFVCFVFFVCFVCFVCFVRLCLSSFGSLRSSLVCSVVRSFPRPLLPFRSFAPKFIPSLLRSFVPLLQRSLGQSWVPSFVARCLPSFVLISSFGPKSFVRSSVCPFLCSCRHRSLVSPFLCLFLCPLLRSFRPSVRPCIQQSKPCQRTLCHNPSRRPFVPFVDTRSYIPRLSHVCVRSAGPDRQSVTGNSFHCRLCFSLFLQSQRTRSLQRERGRLRIFLN